MSLQKQKLYLPSELEKYTHEHSIIWELIGFALILLLLGGSILLYGAWRASEASYSPEPPNGVSSALQKLRNSKIKAYRTVTARITEYGPTGDKMKCGKEVYIGAVAVSDYSIRCGTKVSIMGKTYTVEDHTAQWIAKKFPLPTFDIYSPTPHGMTVVDATILP